MTVRETLERPIGLNELPTRFHSREQVEVWHVRRIVADSADWDEAARRLGITKRTIRNVRAKHPEIVETPLQVDKRNRD